MRKAEKMLLQDDVQLLIAYSNVNNAEPLYQLAASVQRPFIFLDAGMQLPVNAINDYCYHISFQGAHALFIGIATGSTVEKCVAGHLLFMMVGRGPGASCIIAASGSAVCGNYISSHKVAEFTIHQYLSLLQQGQADSVAACF